MTLDLEARQGCVGLIAQCGGQGFGSRCCTAGHVCTFQNQWYSDCQPTSGGGGSTTPPPPSGGGSTPPPAGINPFPGYSLIGDNWYLQNINTLQRNNGNNQALNRLKQPVANWIVRSSHNSDTNRNHAYEDTKAAIEAAEDLGVGNRITQLVVYNLPGRDCAAKSSEGKIRDIPGYKEYIGHIDKAIRETPRVGGHRIVFYIEPDAIGNIVTGVGKRKCNSDVFDNYRIGIRHAIDVLSAIPRSFVYVDLGHSKWTGLPEWRKETADEAWNTVGNRRINGFVTNISNYNKLSEERAYIDNMVPRLNAKGFQNTEFVVDMSRGGQNGYLRGDVGNWCNLKNARIGPVPGFLPGGNIHAAVWIKPPGTSDGFSYDDVCGTADSLQGINTAAGEYSFQMAMSHLGPQN
jgi:cellulose 1,4-beta-cellobiosidase